MIRIQLVREGRVVKQISSRLHEGIVLEQVKQYKDPFDTIVVVEGELSEAGKDILHHVAKKIIPAAMAAGMAMSGAHAQNVGTPGVNRHPGTDVSIGQHMADIFNPQYKEIMRRREAERETGRRVYNAQQDEIRRAEVERARQETRRQYGMPSDGRSLKVYDQARMSPDGKYLILYDMDNRITRISARDLTYMDGDGQRLPHYISASGQAYYVRHPHMTESVAEAFIAPGLSAANAAAEFRRQGQAGGGYRGRIDIPVGSDEDYLTSGKALKRAAKLKGQHIEYGRNGSTMSVFSDSMNSDELDAFIDDVLVGGLGEGFGTIGTVGTISSKGGNTPNLGNATSTRTSATNADGTTNVKFNNQGQLELDDEEELSPDSIATLKAAGIDVKEGAGSTTATLDAVFNEHDFYRLEHIWPALEAGDKQEALRQINHYLNKGKNRAWWGDLKALDIKINPNDVENSQVMWSKPVQGGVAESGYQMNPELAKIIAGNKRAVEYFKQSGELSADLETDLHYYYYDKLSYKAQRDSDDDGEIAELFAEDLGIDLSSLYEGFVTDPELEAILDQYADSFKQFKAGGDLTDNPDFYEALFNYYLNSGEMPYGVAKARDEDPVNWITTRLDREVGIDPVQEAIGADDTDDMASDVEASPADQASADKNIIMQIRRQVDYDKPQPLQLGDGSTITISAKTANKILAKFDQLKPESKSLMQQTLNDAEGFREMLNYFNEREVQTEAGPSSTQYASLADAYPSGSTEIWYWNDEAGRDMMMGANWLSKKGQMPTPETLSQTHVQIGTLRETDPDKIFSMMQGENWSPNGEARNLIQQSNTGHTSMSVGDIMKVGSTYLMVDRFGFHDISKQSTGESIQLSTHIKPVSEAEAMARQLIRSVFEK